MSDLTQLTKKNQEFIHIATQQLIKDGKTNEEIKAILDEHLPTILDNQKKGIPARTFLGAPTVWAHDFTAPRAKTVSTATQKNTNPWLMWLDSSLFLTALVFLMNGLLPIFGNQSEISGLVSILALGFTGGAAVYAIYYFIYRHLGTAERPSISKMLIILLTAFAAWIVISALTSFLPAVINPRLHHITYLVLSGIFFLGRFYLQNKYNILNAMSPTRQ